MRTDHFGAAVMVLLSFMPAAVAGASVAKPTINDDVRCLLLSASYARVAKDENLHRTASMTSAFFLGRLNGRVSDEALASAVRAQGRGLPGVEAQPIMRACAARAAAAEQSMSVAIHKAETAR